MQEMLDKTYTRGDVVSRNGRKPKPHLSRMQCCERESPLRDECGKVGGIAASQIEAAIEGQSQCGTKEQVLRRKQTSMGWIRQDMPGKGIDQRLAQGCADADMDQIACRENAL